MIPIPIPGRLDTSPIVRGRVIDQRTKKPLQGAEISFKDFKSEKRSTIFTQADGSFALGPEKHTYLVKVVTPCPVYYLPDVEPYAWFLEISKEHYVTKSIDLSAIYDQRVDNKFELGDVELVPNKDH